MEIDGVDIPLSEFRVDDGRRLVWESEECFPLCQDLSLPLGEDGTWAVTYKHGLPVPPGGEDVAAELACELIKSCDPNQSDQCRLPDNVRRVTRQGIDIEFQDQNLTGDFGVFSINQWVKSVNPYGVLAPVQVFSPDVARPVMTTWP